MNIIAWIIFGALAGWVASIIAGRNDRQGCLMDIIIGIVGAFIGGLVYELLTGADFEARFNLGSFVVAVVGALILLFIVEAVARRR